MNKPNNKRKKESKEKIEKIFIELIQTKQINEVSITDICKKARLNRTTFYANYIDIYDLADKIKLKLMNDVLDVYEDERNEKKHSYNFLKLFYHIKENQLFYKTYFKLSTDDNLDSFFIDNNEFAKLNKTVEYMDYHIAFFKAGLNAIIKKWLNNNCKESPEEINEIIISEYKK